MYKKIQVYAIAILLWGLSFWAWFRPADEISDSELRKLTQFPAVTVGSLGSGQFLTDFEAYSLDQFPMRDQFRGLKALITNYIYRQKDNNGLYRQSGSYVKMEYPYLEDEMTYAMDRLNYVYENLLANTEVQCYSCVIPDKNYYFAQDHGALQLDYSAMFSRVETELSFAQYLDITPLLEQDSFYKTDPHWNQTKILPVAEYLAKQMGTTVDAADSYQIVQAETPFYGTYYRQEALPGKPDCMTYFVSDTTEAALVYDWQNQKNISVYDESKLQGRTPYDLFLGGSLSLITLENKAAQTDRALVIFRDSFGSSLAPLLLSGYCSVTLVDIRYLPSERLGNYIEFTNQDVLFLYSASVLNHGKALK